MTQSNFKNQVDNLMNILFGAGVASHATIIEQINYLVFLRSLSKKDDNAMKLDPSAEMIFSGELKKYHWNNLLILNADELFSVLEDIFRKLPELTTDQTIKLLFRDAHVKIFDKPTLRRLIHEIEKMFDDLEKLSTSGHTDIFGDMYEYLLSKLSQAGTLGSFRTPRHIVKFMVDVIDPKKGETILDPACGTAGFLVAALKHLEEKYTSEDYKKIDKYPMDLLSSLEREFVYRHTFTGFDSDFDMFKFGLMNLYLHKLEHPNIKRQNTLVDTAGDRTKWDVILANPPFAGALDIDSVSEDLRMGTRATEILFLRYMIDHLSLSGRTGVIIPEGVVFGSTNAHKKIRQMLVEDAGLWCVASLPGGIFNPYAGVKTNILFFDKTLKGKNEEILFIKIKSDGFDLGAKKIPTNKNDLPLALEIIKKWKNKEKAEDKLAVYVKKTKIAEGDDYNLSGDRYHIATDYPNAKWPMIELGQFCTIQRGMSYSTRELGSEGNGTPFYNLKSIKRDSGIQKNDFKYFTGEIKDKHLVSEGDLLIAITDLTPNSELIGSPKLITENNKAAYSADLAKVIFKKSGVIPQYLYSLLRSKNYREYIVTFSHGANVKHLQVEGFYKFKVPLPPTEVQKQIVEEIDGYKKQADNWKKQAEVMFNNKIADVIDVVWGTVESIETLNIFDELKTSIEIIQKDVSELLHRHQVLEILLKDQDNKTNPILTQTIAQTFWDAIVVSIRKQVGKQAQEVSLGNLLKKLSENNRQITEEWYVKEWLSAYKNQSSEAFEIIKGFPVAEFRKYFGTSGYLDQLIVNRDIELLTSDIQEIKDFVDQSRAHRDKDPKINNLEISKIKKALKTIDEVTMKYILLIKQAGMTTLTPTIQ